MRNAVTLACTECKSRNYQTNKNKKNDPDRIEFNKYCKFCKKHYRAHYPNFIGKPNISENRTKPANAVAGFCFIRLHAFRPHGY